MVWGVEIYFQVVLVIKVYIINRGEHMHKVSLCTTATTEAVGVQDTHWVLGEDTRPAINNR